MSQLLLPDQAAVFGVQHHQPDLAVELGHHVQIPAQRQGRTQEKSAGQFRFVLAAVSADDPLGGALPCETQRHQLIGRPD